MWISPLYIVGTPSRIRTCDTRIRSPVLYPAELWVHLWSVTVAASFMFPNDLQQF